MLADLLSVNRFVQKKIGERERAIDEGKVGRGRRGSHLTGCFTPAPPRAFLHDPGLECQNNNMMSVPDMPSLPSEVLEQLNCSVCSAPLSCTPVYTSSSGVSVCGRCTPPPNEAFVKNVLFEKAMSKFKFPCRYKSQGCKVLFQFGTLLEHENTCSYQIYRCPSTLPECCPQHMSALDIYDHFQEKHEDSIIKNNIFKLNVVQDSQSNLLMQDGVPALFQYSYNSTYKVFRLKMYYFPSKEYEGVNYNLQIAGELGFDCAISLKQNACLQFTSFNFNTENPNVFPISNYLLAFGNPDHVYINIKLTANTNNDFPSSKSIERRALTESEKQIRKASKALERFRCTQCFSITPSSKLFNLQMKRCIKCAQPTGYVRNSRIPSVNSNENVANETYPCTWRNCNFTGTATDMEKHWPICMYKTSICPLQCQEGFFLLSKINEHASLHAAEYCPNPENVLVSLHKDCPRSYFAIFENTAVIITRSFSNRNEWSLNIDTEGDLLAEVHLEHEHCSITSSISKMDSRRECNLSFFNLPPCFEYCPPSNAIVTIVRKP